MHGIVQFKNLRQIDNYLREVNIQ